MKKEYKRFRAKVVSFRLSEDEYIKFRTRVISSGLTKNDFMINSVLNQHIEVKLGVFYSNKLCYELKSMNKKLMKLSDFEEIRELVKECRELVRQLISLLDNSN